MEALAGGMLGEKKGEKIDGSDRIECYHSSCLQSGELVPPLSTASRLSFKSTEEREVYDQFLQISVLSPQSVLKVSDGKRL